MCLSIGITEAFSLFYCKRRDRLYYTIFSRECKYAYKKLTANADIFAKGPNARLPSVFVIDRGLGRRREEDIRQFRNPGEGIVCTVVEWTVMDEGETSRMLSPYSSLLLVLQQ